MCAMETPLSPADETYRRLAPFYDELTRDHDYDGWTWHLEQTALTFGVRGRRLLDAACGTGKSFMPFLARGYAVTGCDISPEMLAIASAKAPEVELFAGDVRELGHVGEFDLITCLDDAVNYLTGDADLDLAFGSFARNLATDGVLVFDLNTVSTYRTTWASDATLESPQLFLVWRGRVGEGFEPGGLAELIVEAFSETAPGVYERVSSRHLERHHPRPDVERALAGAGLAAVGVFGLLPDGSLDTVAIADEDLHHKFVYFAQRVAEGGDTE
jgi:SAM-dependent methyltransferase